MKVIEAYLTPNPYSRTQKKLNPVKGLCIHWVANPNTTALANRNFFENRKLGKTDYGAAHDIIDLNGDLIRCIPDDEEAYQVGSSLVYKPGSTQIYTPIAWEKLNTNSNKKVQPYPNNCMVGVECTHLDWAGVMSKETMESLFQWCVEKLKKFNLTADDLYLHKEVVGWKDCHYWFVKNPDEWTSFKNRVRVVLNPVIENEEDEEMKEELAAAIKRIEALELKTKVLDKTPAPDWFTTEFGGHVLDGIVSDMTGDTDFWRDTAVSLRLKKKG